MQMSSSFYITPIKLRELIIIVTVANYRYQLMSLFFRISEAVDQGVYEFLDKIYSGCAITNTSDPHSASRNISEVLESCSHHSEDFIERLLDIGADVCQNDMEIIYTIRAL